MRHIKLTSINRRLFWMHLEMHEVVQGSVHVDPHPHMFKDRHIKKFKRVMTHEVH
jgi:hypothetical protein